MKRPAACTGPRRPGGACTNDPGRSSSHKLHLNLRNASFQVNGCHFSTLKTNNKRNIQKVTQKAELPKTGGAEKLKLPVHYCEFPLKTREKFDYLLATQGGPEIPITTRDESRVSRHNSTRTPCVPPHPEMRAHSLLQLKRNPNFPSHHKRRPVSSIES